MEGSLVSYIQKKYEEKCLPMSVHFELTNRCNLRCQHCYLTDYSGKGELSKEEVLDAFRQLARAGALVLFLSGGEIFLRKDIHQILRAATQLFSHVILLTNGTLITREMARFLKEMAITQVEVSLYSSLPEVHDSITGVKDSFEQTLKALEYLQEAGVPTVVKCSVMEGRLDESRALKEIAERYGARYRPSPVIIPKRDGNKENQRYCLSKNDQEIYYQELILSQKVKLLPPSDKPAAPVDLTKRGPCRAGRTSASIAPDGTVRPCPILPLNLGSLREKTFEQIWVTEPGEVLKKLKKVTQADFKDCLSCDIKHACAPCMGQNYLENGDLLSCARTHCNSFHVFQEQLRLIQAEV